MPAYKAPLREYRYVLHEVLGAERALPRARSRRHQCRADRGRARGRARFAEDVVAPTNEPGDRVGVRRTDDGRVVTPPGFVEAYRQYVDDGWASLCGPAEAGGQGLPESLGGVVGEMLVSANMSWKLYSGLTDSAVLCLDKHGDAGDEERLPSEARERRLERHDGADRAARRHGPRPHAHPRGAGRDGSYRVSGTKIFITSGEHDLTENIAHMVLAKLPDAPAGSQRHQHVPRAEIPAGCERRAGPGEWRQLREHRAQARHPRFRDLRR